MNLKQISARIKLIEPELKSRGVKHVAVFGSRARGDYSAESDLDLLLDVQPNAALTIVRLAAIERVIAAATGLTANTFLRRGLDDKFRQSIETDMQSVF
jgi:uncharacterized protein